MGTNRTMPDAPIPVADENGVRLPPPPTQLNRPALFLDLDGVLARLVATPDAVVPDTRRTAALRSLESRLNGRVAIVSGRTIAEIDRIAESSTASASGVHGLERRRADGSIERAEPAAEVRDAVAAFVNFARDRPGMIVEDKAVSAGLHFRGAPHHGEGAMSLAYQLARQTGLALQAGHLVIELKTPGTDKGTALTAFMSEAPFRGSVPIMVGDDLTDEHGFEAAAALGGFGILVGPPRATAARHGLPDVDAVLTWLDAVEETA